MLSSSRIQDQCANFMQKMSDLSNQIALHYFSDQSTKSPNHPFKISRSLIEEYTFIYDHCTSKPSFEEKMFDLYKGALKRHLIQHMSELSGNPNRLISVYNTIWESYTTFARILSKKIFAYLDRYYIPANDHKSLYDTSIDVFITGFFTENTARAFLSAYCQQLNNIRKTKVIHNRDLLNFSVSISLIDCEKLFPLLMQIYYGESKRFYESCVQHDDQQDPMTYLTFVNNLYYFEQLLMQRCMLMGSSQVNELGQIFNEILVKNYTKKLIDAPYGFLNMLRNQKAKQLKMVSAVFCRQQGFQNLRVSLESFITSEGQIRLNKVNQADSPPETVVNTFYQFSNEYTRLVSECFNKNDDMDISLRHGLEKLASKNDKLPEILFKYARKVLDEGNFDRNSEKILTIFEKLSDKDQFLNMYRKSLEDKILTNSLVFMIEKKFIQKMDGICGSHLTSTLDKILEDCIESMPTAVMPVSPNFKVMVVSQYHWEKRFNEQITLNLTLFGELANLWGKFEDNYIEHFPKKKLTLMPYETKVSLNLIHNKKQTSFKCNLIQACIILFAAAKNNIDEEDLITNLTLEKTFVQRFLESIPIIKPQQAMGKYRFDWMFSSQESLINLDSIVQEEKKVTKNVEQDREILIQAAIIKTLKRSKSMEFQELIHEVNSRIKLFKPTSANIKKAMETLMKKDMVEFGEDGKVNYIE